MRGETVRIGVKGRRLGRSWRRWRSHVPVDNLVTTWLFVLAIAIGDPLACVLFCRLHMQPAGAHTMLNVHAHHALPITAGAEALAQAEAHAPLLTENMGCHLPFLSGARTALQSEPFMPVFGRLAALLLIFLLPLPVLLRRAPIPGLRSPYPARALAPPLRPPIPVTR